MLESTSERLCEKGGVHYGSPDKHPAVRLETIRLAGELKVPFTTGILIGIGETRDERIETLEAIRDLHEAHGHIQEVIVQNFRAKPDTKRADADEPDLDDLLWTIAQARLILGPDMNIQAPPNLSPGVYPRLIGAGLNDWGGISPVTPDHVNPEAPWPAIDELARASAEMGKLLVNRLAIYPAYARAPDTWLAPEVATQVRRMSDAEGFARDDDWAPGNTEPPPAPLVLAREVDARDRAHRRSRDRRPAARPSGDHAPVRGARCRLPPRHRRRQCAAPGGQRRRRALRRQPQHQLHQHLLFPLPLLRLLQGPHARGSARRALRSRAGGSVAARGRGVAARRHRGLPAGRHPSRLYRRDLCRDLPRHQGRGTRHAHPCLLAARGDPGRRDPAGAARRPSWRN